MSDLPPPPGNQPPFGGYGEPYPPGQSQPYGQPPQGQYQQYGYGYGYAGGAAYAGFWIRFAAYLLDGLIVGIPLNILTLALPIGLSLLVRIAATAVYFALLEGSATGQTLGKKICSIRVVDASSGQPGIGGGRAVGRYFAKWLSGLVLALGFLWMLWDPKKQTWHDKLATTLVVKV